MPRHPGALNFHSTTTAHAKFWHYIGLLVIMSGCLSQWFLQRPNDIQFVGINEVAFVPVTKIGAVWGLSACSIAALVGPQGYIIAHIGPIDLDRQEPRSDLHNVEAKMNEFSELLRHYTNLFPQGGSSYAICATFNRKIELPEHEQAITHHLGILGFPASVERYERPTVAQVVNEAKEGTFFINGLDGQTPSVWLEDKKITRSSAPSVSYGSQPQSRITHISTQPRDWRYVNEELPYRLFIDGALLQKTSHPPVHEWITRQDNGAQFIYDGQNMTYRHQQDEEEEQVGDDSDRVQWSEWTWSQEHQRYFQYNFNTKKYRYQ